MNKYFQHIKRYFSNEEASTLPIVALAFPVIIGFAGLGTDAAYWMSEKRELQAAADAAVLAAGFELANDSSEYMDTAAFREAGRNGYHSDANGVMQLNTVSSGSDGTVLAVTLTQDANTFFSKIVFPDPIRVSAYAEAHISGVTGNFCILALEELQDDSLSTFGAVNVEAPTCGLAVNSNSPEALTLTGNSSVEVGTVRVVGDYDTQGGSVNFIYSDLQTGTAPLDDPYDELDVPEDGPCDENNKKVTSSTYLTPGRYCGGLDISGDSDIELDPGTYIIDGGDLKITGSGTITGDDVTIILTGEGSKWAQVDISGSRELSLYAPDSGDYSGVVFYQDRNSPYSKNAENKIVGTSKISLNGAVYFPNQGVRFGGNSEFIGETEPCTRLIARTVTLAGNPSIGNKCEGYDVEDIGSPTGKLIK